MYLRDLHVLSLPPFVTPQPALYDLIPLEACILPL